MSSTWTREPGAVVNGEVLPAGTLVCHEKEEGRFRVHQTVTTETTCWVDCYEDDGRRVMRSFRPGTLFLPGTRKKTTTTKGTKVAKTKEATTEGGAVRLDNQGVCQCGCGAEAVRRFLPGHDQRLAGALGKAAKGGDLEALAELLALFPTKVDKNQDLANTATTSGTEALSLDQVIKRYEARTGRAYKPEG